MSLGKHSKTVLFWIPLLAGLDLSISLAGNTAIAASPTSERSATLVSLTLPQFALEDLVSLSAVSSTVREMAWLDKDSADTIVFLQPLNHKKDKHDDDEDQGNWDDDRRDRGYDRDERQKGSVSVQVVFGERDREIIREYCSQQYSNLPPGLAKRGGELPPGLEKHLRRNGRLPPGLQKKVERFPRKLERRLPRLPSNYVRVFVGGRGLIVDAQFNIIDIIDIFR